jgi:hypothetical protein
MISTLPATFDHFDTNASLRPHEDAVAGGYTRMNAPQRDLFARRFSNVDTSLPRAMAEIPGAAEFIRPPDQLERGVSRIRASSTPPWRGPLPEGMEHFNKSVHCDWMCIGTRAFGPLDGTWTGAAAGAASDVGTRVVSDALVIVNRAYWLVQVTTVASHSEFTDCVKRRVHTLGAMRALTADGEAANHSGNVADLLTHYGVSFARLGAPYHPHHNGPVETMVKLLKPSSSTWVGLPASRSRRTGRSSSRTPPTSSTSCLACLCKGAVLARRWTGLRPTFPTFAPSAARP